MGRDVELDIVGHDHTGRATRSAGHNLDQLKRKVDGVNRSTSSATKGVRGMVDQLVAGSAALRSGGPYVVLAAITAAIAALPAVGSLAAGGLVSALGGGLVAIGVLAAAQNAKVRAAFGSTLAYIRSVAPQFGAPFVPVLTRLAERIRGTFTLFAPELTKSMQTLAPVVDRFLGNIQAAVMQLRPIIGPVTAAFAALMDAVGPQVPVIMNQLAAAINRVADSIRNNPQTFASLISFIGKTVVAVVNLIATLSNMANWFQRHPNITKALIVGITGLGSAIVLFQGTATRALQSVGSAVGRMAAAFGGAVAHVLRSAARAADAVGMDGAAAKLRRNADAIESTTRAIQASINSLTGKTITVTTKFVYKGQPAFRTPGGNIALDGSSSWQAAAAGSFTTGGPAPVVNVGATTVDSRVYIDGQELRAVARSVVREELGRAGTRARYGRAR